MRYLLLLLSFLVSASLHAQDSTVHARREHNPDNILLVKGAYGFRTPAQSFEAGVMAAHVYGFGGPCGIPGGLFAAGLSAELRYRNGLTVMPKVSAEAHFLFFGVRGGMRYNIAARRPEFTTGMGLSIFGLGYVFYGWDFTRTGEPAVSSHFIEAGINFPLFRD